MELDDDEVELEEEVVEVTGLDEVVEPIGDVVELAVVELAVELPDATELVAVLICPVEDPVALVEATAVKVPIV